MKAIEAIATVSPEGELSLRLKLPLTIAPGNHRVVVVIEDKPASSPEPTPLQLQTFDWPGWPANATFRRDDLYENNGR